MLRLVRYVLNGFTRRARESEQRLIDAVESISEGFSLFDADDRLSVAGRRAEALAVGQFENRLDASPNFLFAPFLRIYLSAPFIHKVNLHYAVNYQRMKIIL